MAVISAAIAAVTAAVATTTVATVATAVVAVSVAIGTVGAVVGTVGAVIGNKDLMFAGKIMGYVGLAGGLAGGLMGGLGAMAGAAGSEGLTFGQGFAETYASYSQHLSEGWKNGVGSWFSGGEKVAGAAGSTPGAAPGTPPAAGSQVTQGGVNPTDFATGGTGPSTPAQTATLNPINSGAIEGTQAPIAAPTSASVSAPSAGGTGAPSVVTPGAPDVMGALNPSFPAAGGQGTGLVGSVGKAFSDMPDWMKYSMMTTGAQGVTGLASGYFQGAQAEAQLAQQQKLNDRNEAYRQELLKNANAIPTFQFSH